MDNKSGWRSYTATDLEAMPPEVRNRLAAEQSREPIAEVTVKLFGLDRGQSELQVRISPNGALKDGSGTGPGRSAAYQKLLECLQREIAEGLATLRDD